MPPAKTGKTAPAAPAAPCNRSTPSPRRLVTIWAGVFLAFSALYVTTAQPGVSWQDSGMFQWRVVESDYAGDLGLALAHPSYIVAGRVLWHIPVGDFAWRMNAFSGIGMAVALATLAAFVTWLTRNAAAGVLAAGLLGLSHTPWWLSTIAEVYTWVAAGLAIELWLLAALWRRPRWTTLSALALVSGLGWVLHNFALLPLPVYLAVAIILILRRRLPAWSLATGAVAYMLGASMYLAMIAQEASATGVVAAVHSALFGEYRGEVVSLAPSGQMLRANAMLAAINLVGLLAPVGIVGWVVLRRCTGRGLAIALGCIGAIHFLFVVRYPVPDQFTFLLPTLLMVALGTGVGLAWLMDGPARRRQAIVALCLASMVVQVGFLAAGPRLARAVLGDRPIRPRELPFRDELAYWLVPWKHGENSAQLFARSALAEASAHDGPGGVILADETSLYPLLVVRRLEGIGPDTLLNQRSRLPSYCDQPDAFHRQIGPRPLFVVSPVRGYAPGCLLDEAAAGRVEFQRPPGHVLHRVRRLDGAN